MITKEQIGKKLKEERLKANISLETLSEYTDIACSTLSLYESQGISDIEKITDICIALNISPEIVLGTNKNENIKSNINDIIYDKDNIDIILENESFFSGLKQIDCDIKMDKNIVCLSNDNKIFMQKFEELKNNGYDIRLVNFVNLDADCYNPLEYIKNDRDTIEFANHFMINIHKQNNTNLLLCALIEYLIKYRPKEEQNFTSIMKLLRAAEVDGDNPNAKSPLDRIFDEVQKRDPNSIALKEYRMFKMKEPLLAQNQIAELCNLLVAYDTNDLGKFTSIDTVRFNELCDENKKIAIFVIAPIESILLPLYETFKYQLYK